MILNHIAPLLTGWIADKLLGDPPSLPHPIVGMGKIISYGEKKLNKGKKRMLKGGIFSVTLILLSFQITYLIIKYLSIINPYLSCIFSAIIIFFCLAGKTLSDEVKAVFIALNCSADKGRKQVARIVGRDTSALSPQQIRTAALETLSENLSDGVIAPLFWYMLLGVPGMFAYKMINTLDSMIGYKNERFKQFGCVAARIDDIANYIPARLTAVLMIITGGNFSVFSFVKKYGKQHSGPNSGYPEAALAGILDCRFGGPNIYFGKVIDKPYIGNNPRELTFYDMQRAIIINKKAENAMILLVICYVAVINIILK